MQGLRIGNAEAAVRREQAHRGPTGCPIESIAASLRHTRLVKMVCVMRPKGGINIVWARSWAGFLGGRRPWGGMQRHGDCTACASVAQD